MKNQHFSSPTSQIKAEGEAVSGLKALTGLEMCYPVTTRAYHSGGTSVGDEHLEMRGEKKKEGNAKENDLKMGENDLLSLFFYISHH